MSVNQGEKIKQLIWSKGLNIEDVAKKLGFSKQTFYNKIAKTPIDEEFKDRLIKEIGLSLDESSTSEIDLEAENAHLRAELEKARKRIDELTDAILRLTEKK